MDSGTDRAAIEEHRMQMLAEMQAKTPAKAQMPAKTPGGPQAAPAAPAATMGAPTGSETGVDCDEWSDPKLVAHRQAAREKLEAARAYKARVINDATLVELTAEKCAINAMQTEDNKAESGLVLEMEAAMQAMREAAKNMKKSEESMKRLRNRRALSFAQTQGFQQKLLETAGARLRSAEELKAQVAQLTAALAEQTALTEEYHEMLVGYGIAV